MYERGTYINMQTHSPAHARTQADLAAQHNIMLFIDHRQTITLTLRLAHFLWN